MDTVPLVHIMQTVGAFPPHGDDDGDDRQRANYVLGLIHHYSGLHSIFETPIDGPVLKVERNQALYAVIGPRDDDWTKPLFQLPDFRGKVLVGRGGDPAALPAEAAPVRYLIASRAYIAYGAPMLGAVMAFAGRYVPEGWMTCDGRLLDIGGHEQLYSVIGNQYGGDGVRKFALPNLSGAAPIGVGTRGDRVVTAGQRVDGPIPGVGMHYMLAINGIFGTRDSGYFYEDERVFGEVIAFAGHTIPDGWMECDGRVLPVRDQNLLHYIYGATYGGDGEKTVALPDLVGRAIIGRFPKD
ncbi:tail fiber protein [Sphingomonas sp. CJ20]